MFGWRPVTESTRGKRKRIKRRSLIYEEKWVLGRRVVNRGAWSFRLTLWGSGNLIEESCKQPRQLFQPRRRLPSTWSCIRSEKMSLTWNCLMLGLRHFSAVISCTRMIWIEWARALCRAPISRSTKGQFVSSHILNRTQHTFEAEEESEDGSKVYKQRTGARSVFRTLTCSLHQQKHNFVYAGTWQPRTSNSSFGTIVQKSEYYTQTITLLPDSPSI